MKPFDLEKALAGEPVMLRDKSKAFVKFEVPDYLKVHNFADIVGYKISDDNFIVKEWDSSGIARFCSPSEDIIGMWQEPRPRVQLDLPAPLKEPQEGMWFLDRDDVSMSGYKLAIHNKWIEINKDSLYSGFYFATKQDAQEWLDAMRNARR